MRLFLKLLLGAIFVWVIVLTIRTALAVSLWDARPSYAANSWAIATSLYMLTQFMRLRAEEPAEAVLWRRSR